MDPIVTATSYSSVYLHTHFSEYSNLAMKPHRHTLVMMPCPMRTKDNTQSGFTSDLWVNFLKVQKQILSMQQTFIELDFISTRLQPV